MMDKYFSDLNQIIFCYIVINDDPATHMLYNDFHPP